MSDPDLAEDILQNSLLKSLRAAPDLRDEEKSIPWLYRIVRNAITDTYRRKRREVKYLEQYAGEVDDRHDPEGEQALCACFRELIPTLKPEYSELIERVELADGDPEQVAEQLGITRNNLKVRRHRARQQLRERLKETCRTCADHGCIDCTCKVNA